MFFLLLIKFATPAVKTQEKNHTAASFFLTILSSDMFIFSHFHYRTLKSTRVDISFLIGDYTIKLLIGTKDIEPPQAIT